MAGAKLMLGFAKWLVEKAFGWLAGGTLDRILKTVDNTIDNETERQEIRAKAVIRHVEIAAETRQVAMQSRVFWYTWALFAAPLGLWFAAVCFDSVFQFQSFDVADLPSSVKPYANQIFAAVFGTGGGVAGVQAIASAIRGR